MNIGANQEAIEHFLGALALQESSGGGKSEQLWTTLRRAFQSMVRTAVRICFAGRSPDFWFAEPAGPC